MEATLGVLADFASITREGKLNIMGIFGEINPPILPFQLPQAFLVVILEAGAAEYNTDKNLKVVLLNSDGKTLLTIGQNVKVTVPKRAGSRVTINAVIGMAGIKFDNAGDYAFSVLIGDEEKKSISLYINEPVSAKGV